MATQKAFQEELNPYEIEKQQFNRAADYLDLDSSMRRVLEHATRQLIVSIPVKMDGGTRVTDEKSPVEVLVPDHPLFRFPNVITTQDWNGWVQERGLYFLNEWDPQYVPLLASVDESGRKQSGGELIAKVGKGNYVFTAYAWFRQFPAGVPGAYRLFANLVSLSKAK